MLLSNAAKKKRARHSARSAPERQERNGNLAGELITKKQLVNHFPRSSCAVTRAPHRGHVDVGEHLKDYVGTPAARGGLDGGHHRCAPLAVVHRDVRPGVEHRL